jgi:hypothetical protein
MPIGRMPVGRRSIHSYIERPGNERLGELMLKVVFVSAVFAAAFMGKAQAEEPRTGEDLFRQCQSPPEQDDGAYCTGYVRGIEMLVRWRDERQKTCTFSVPAEVADRELVDAVIASIDANSALLRQRANDVVRAALTDKWPCS